MKKPRVKVVRILPGGKVEEYRQIEEITPTDEIRSTSFVDPHLGEGFIRRTLRRIFGGPPKKLVTHLNQRDRVVRIVKSERDEEQKDQ